MSELIKYYINTNKKMGNVKAKFRGEHIQAEIKVIVEGVSEDDWTNSVQTSQAFINWKEKNNFKINDQVDMICCLDNMTDAQL